MGTNPQFMFDVGSPNAYLSHEAIPAIEKRTGPRSNMAASCTSRPRPVLRQPPLKNVLKPWASETREKPQRWYATIEESRCLAYLRERGGTSRSKT